jgi:cell division protein FtsN
MIVAEIHVEADAVAATATALLALTDNVDDVALTHGPTGVMFVVPDDLAEKLLASSKKKDSEAKTTDAKSTEPKAADAKTVEPKTDEAPKPESDGAPQAPKADPRRPVNPRAKTTPDQE